MRKDAVPVLLLVFIAVLYFAPVIFSHQTFIARDIYIFYNPKHFFAAENIKAGTIPLWNPYLACGVPFQANVQSCIFYPFSSIYYLLPFQLGYKYFIIMHYLMGSLFMFFLMRQWNCSTFGSLFAGVVFAYGGYLASILDNVCFLAAAIWLPFILLFHHRALASGSFFYAMVTALGIALQVYAGDASFYVGSTVLCLVLYTLFWQAMKHNFPSSLSRLRAWGLLFCSVTAGLLLASAQLIPMAELVLHSTRFEGLQYETVVKWSYHPLEFLQLLIPYVFGSTVPETRWFGQFWLDTLYIGILPLMLAVLYVCYCRRPINYFLFTLLLFGCFFALGEHNPLIFYCYKFIPGMNMLQYPVKLLFPAAFSLSIMAGMGAAYFTDDLNHDTALKKYLLGFVLLLCILVTALAAGLVFKQQLYGYFQHIYPGTPYYLAMQKDCFFQFFQGLSTSVIMFSLVFMVMGALFTGRLQKPISRYILFGIMFADLAIIGKPGDPYVPESLMTRSNPTTDLLKNHTEPYRTFSHAYITHQNSFMHLFNADFQKLYQAFQEELLPNLNMYYHISAVDEYTELLNTKFYQLFNPVQTSFAAEKLSPAERMYRDKILNLLNVKYIISTLDLKASGFRLIREGPIKIYENPGCMPRAFFAANLQLVENETAVLRNMRQPSFDPYAMVYISQPELRKLRGEFIPPSDRNHAEPFRGSVRFTDYQPNSVSLQAQLSQARFLIISDNYFPGWRAFVDGVERPLLRVDYTLRGLLLDAGDHDITLVFWPRSFVVGVGISLITGCLMMASILVLIKKKKRSAHGSKCLCTAGRDTEGSVTFNRASQP
jgi:hypothetical protein